MVFLTVRMGHEPKTFVCVCFFFKKRVTRFEISVPNITSLAHVTCGLQARFGSFHRAVIN